MPGIDALAPLLDALADVHVAPDEALPDTGVGLELERMLSPAFVRDARYGTRCSSVVLVGDGGIVFAERRFGADAVPLGESVVHLYRELAKQRAGALLTYSCSQPFSARTATVPPMPARHPPSRRVLLGPGGLAG